MSSANSAVLDAEFADDTTLYIRGDTLYLDRVQNALQIFLDATGASLNWNKSVGLWTNDEPYTEWYPGPVFHGLNHGEPIRYLGCLVGIDLPSEVMLSPLLLSIKCKLVY